MYRVAGLFLSCLVAGCAGGGSFADRPGFREWFAANPPNPDLPTDAEQALLERHRPHLFVAGDVEGPVSFYDDYIAHGYLKDENGKRVSDAVTSALLNQHADSSAVTFVHTGKVGDPISPEALGRVDYATLEGVGQLTFLTWHFVFRSSGLPGGLSGIKKAAMQVVGDLTDWHQLDHYTAATLVLSADAKPFALMLQQHNYRRSFIFGCDLPAEEAQRPRIIAARGSNELYPWADKVVNWRAVSFFNDKNLRWLVLGKKRPTMSADDIADPGREVAYRLGAVPGTDAFYQFQGSLGERRLLPGRSGPPGADYDTLPAQKDLELKLIAANWVENDEPMMEQLIDVASDAWEKGHVDPAARAWFRERFIKRLRSDCSVF